MWGMENSSSVTLTPLGGAREIGANSYLIRAKGYDILLDCGVHPKKEGVESLPVFSLLGRAPDAVIISHGHVDHCGALPELMKEFPQTAPFVTKGTLAVMDRMLHNSVSVMGILAQERHIPEYPLYTHRDVDYVMRNACGMDFGAEFAVKGNGAVSATFHHAGHVLGSASVLMQIDGHSLFYTGDICTADQELMAGLTPLDESVAVDTLIIESTYGANLRADTTTYEEEIERFGRAVTRVIERGGCVLVPAFALGRTQETLNIVARLQEERRIPDAPVYASGLGRAIYEVYARFPEYLHPDANLRPLAHFDRAGDLYDGDTRRELLREPCIVVATSGMMVEETPSAMLAQDMVRDPRHGIFFVGYLDPDTLGYKLLHAEKGARLRFGLNRPRVRVELEDIVWFHFGSHAPREALRAIIKRTNPKNVVFVHGDPEAIDWMHDQTSEEHRRYAPHIGQAVTLEV